MGLRDRIIVLVCLAALMSGAAFYALTWTMIQAARGAFETEQAQQRLADIRVVLGERLAALAEQSVAFHQGPAALRSEMEGVSLTVRPQPTSAMLRAQGVDALIVVRSSGSVLWAKAVDDVNGRETPLPESLSRFFFSREEWVVFRQPDEHKKGFLLIDNRPALAVSRPLLSAGPEPDITGAVVLCRFLDAAEGALISQRARAPVSIYPRAEVPAVFRQDAARLDARNPLTIAARDTQTMVALGLIEDGAGSPFLVAGIEMPRVAHGRGGITLLSLAVVLCSVLFGAALLKVFERLMLIRLTAIHQTLLRIRTDKNLALRVPEHGNDELTGMAREINILLAALAKDIAKRCEMQEELNGAYQRLKQTQQELIRSGKMAAMGQLAAGISHELNQPLTGIKGFSQMVLGELAAEDRHRGDLEKIIEQADRMDRIIQNVRLFARRSEFEKKPLDVREVIEKTLALMTQQLKVHNIRLIKEFADPLPRINADFSSLQQVFVNLLTNARDAIDAARRGDGGEIRIAVAADGGAVQIVVSDNGAGIAPDHVEHIFNPFFTTKSPKGGMGLGLSIVYRIIEEHHGVIHVSSAVGSGTKFTVSIPAVPASAAAARNPVAVA